MSKDPFGQKGVAADIINHLDPDALPGFLHAAFITSSLLNGMIIFETWINCLLNDNKRQQALEEMEIRIDTHPFNKNANVCRLYALLRFKEWREKVEAKEMIKIELNSDGEEEEDDEEDENDKERRERTENSLASRLLGIVKKAADMIPGDSQLKGAQLELLVYLKDFNTKKSVMKKIYRYAVKRRDPSQMSLLLYYWPENHVGSTDWKNAALCVCQWDPIADVNVALRPLLENLKEKIPGLPSRKNGLKKRANKIHKTPARSSKAAHKRVPVVTSMHDHEYENSVRNTCFEEVSAWIVSFDLLLNRLSNGAADNWTIQKALQIVEFYNIMRTLPRYTNRQYIIKFLLENVCNRDMETPIMRLIELCRDEPLGQGILKIEKLEKILEHCTILKWHYEVIQPKPQERHVPKVLSDPFISSKFNEIGEEVWEEIQENTPENNKSRILLKIHNGRTEADILTKLQNLILKKTLKTPSQVYKNIEIESEDELQDDHESSPC
ncbi:hypothetical protein CLU79DRAFT_848406 [Phycomyces nitens]|nr:hypothetical protein CLU79DRAFT_848406 [Phycomyces nitens]